MTSSWTRCGSFRLSIRLTKHPEANVACSTTYQHLAYRLSTASSPPSPGVAASALLIAAGTVGLGGALRGIFTAGDEDNEDKKFRSIQGVSTVFA
jgi:hypothetical protein